MSGLVKNLESVRVVHANKEIAKFADRKDLASAVRIYEEAVRDGWANTHTYCSTINAYVRCSNINGAVSVSEAMKQKGYRMDVVAYTTLMKGFCSCGNIDKAYELLLEMTENKPKVQPNIRTINTILRGCVFSGNVLMAEDVLMRMKDWGLNPDISCTEYLCQLYSQSLNMDKLLPMSGRVTEDSLASIGRASIFAVAARAACILGDWKNFSKFTSKSLEAITNDEILTTDEVLDNGDSENGTVSGGKRAWHTKEADSSRKDSLEVFRVHRRSELRLFISGMQNYASDKVYQNMERKINAILGVIKTISFDHVVQIGSESTVSIAKNNLLDDILSCYVLKLGLPSLLARLCNGHPFFQIESPSKIIPKKKTNEKSKGKAKGKHSEKHDISTMVAALKPRAIIRDQDSFLRRIRNILDNCMSEQGQFSLALFEYLLMERIAPLLRRFFTDSIIIETEEEKDSKKQNFQNPPSGERKLKLEICSGAGEWAVAQAKCDKDSQWATLEVRFDRVYQTLSNAVFQDVTNMSMICGDAVNVVNNLLIANSIDTIFINHPEPPQQTGNHQNPESQGQHLLTKEFIESIFKVLAPNGRLIIVTDNNWYAKLLMKEFAFWSYPRPFSSVYFPDNSEFRQIDFNGNIYLYEGKPGKSCGHIVEASSYFDRLWKREQINERFIFVLAKEEVRSGPVGVFKKSNKVRNRETEVEASVNISTMPAAKRAKVGFIDKSFQGSQKKIIFEDD